MSTKDIHKWIEVREEKAMSAPQLRQAKLMREFLKKDKKLEIDIQSEMKELADSTGKFRSEAKRNNVTENTLKNIINSLESINRKYRDVYEDLNSAATNFEFWTPNR